MNESSESSPLVVQELRKVYGEGTSALLEAVRGISFSISPGECLGLLGPNGAGKSSTMKCIVGISPSSGGSVRIFGIDVHAHPREARKRLGVCAQDDTLDTDFSVLDQMVRYGSFFRMPLSDAQTRARELLERFGLWEKRGANAETLSGGMRRRLQVARCLMSRPRLIVLDEPTTGLDPEVRRSLWEILVELRSQGVAVLLSTHYMDEAERLCDRVAIMHQGRILDTAPPSDLIVRHVAREHVEEEVRPGVVWKRPVNLEDVYLKLTGSSLTKEAGDEG